ncbi:hypothetical protein NDU88_003703 [Pleurodeles waltl]|uniref:Uncharacterized protein n=1 Tax=Pleurodeles waltl TaxID=8319 RepID=A0AAV7LMB9_PLEWA|nr:hypothetical protein NDU88_003703 [Pleurodeles waltl]
MAPHLGGTEPGTRSSQAQLGSPSQRGQVRAETQEARARWQLALTSQSGSTAQAPPAPALVASIPCSRACFPRYIA